jgi:hypothetical protein
VKKRRRRKPISADLVDVGRSTIYGNPVRMDRLCPLCHKYHRLPGDTLDCFKKYAEYRLKKDPPYRNAVLALKGKKLWCPGCGLNSPTCHARILEDMSKHDLQDNSGTS